MKDNYYSVHIYKDKDYDNPKEIFKFNANIIAHYFAGRQDVSILDVGCAKGEFLYYLKSQLANSRPYLCGVDFNQTLIELAKQFSGLNGVDFYNVEAQNLKIEKRFDVIIACGVMGFFDDYTELLDNLMAHLKLDGMLLLTWGFVESEYDTIVKYRHYNENQLEPGWNMHSLQGIEHFMQARGKKVIRHKFALPFKLNKTDDAIRSWTLNTDEGQMFTCGLNLAWNVWSLEAK